ncbi:phosphoesterase [Thermococcus sp. M36]|uniref:phosphatase PAP2 family protein n=1 Tax=Thermococcus sp. M36 TaxID=1638261 RepID=UPI00143C113B|nr:phosphatase PAP2 family protein [Thermococcus sp. M36]NJE04567.1 phosphoesterase [Thermococcus sp. M36]
MDTLRQRLHDPAVLLRLNAFLMSYFGWIAFGIIYGYLGRWSIDFTGSFLELPLTSRDLVLGLVELTKSVPFLDPLFSAVYYLGFSGSIALTVAYLLLYKRDLEGSDELFLRYLGAYAVAGVVYLVAHVHAPHMVYGMPGYTSVNTLLTRQEFVLPSLHNTFVAIHIITLWKYRKSPSGRALIGMNTMIPFATVLLGHHWIYDVVTGFLLGIAVSRFTEGRHTDIPEVLYGIEVRSLRRITVFNLLLAILVLIVAVDPERWHELVTGILQNP